VRMPPAGKKLRKNQRPKRPVKRPAAHATTSPTAQPQRSKVAPRLLASELPHYVAVKSFAGHSGLPRDGARQYELTVSHWKALSSLIRHQLLQPSDDLFSDSAYAKTVLSHQNRRSAGHEAAALNRLRLRFGLARKTPRSLRVDTPRSVVRQAGPSRGPAGKRKSAVRKPVSTVPATAAVAGPPPPTPPPGSLVGELVYMRFSRHGGHFFGTVRAAHGDGEWSVDFEVQGRRRCKILSSADVMKARRPHTDRPASQSAGQAVTSAVATPAPGNTRSMNTRPRRAQQGQKPAGQKPTNFTEADVIGLEAEAMELETRADAMGPVGRCSSKRVCVRGPPMQCASLPVSPERQGTADTGGHALGLAPVPAAVADLACAICHTSFAEMGQQSKVSETRPPRSTDKNARSTHAKTPRATICLGHTAAEVWARMLQVLSGELGGYHSRPRRQLL
jgi:hypothetical protein